MSGFEVKMFTGRYRWKFIVIFIGLIAFPLISALRSIQQEARIEAIVSRHRNAGAIGDAIGAYQLQNGSGYPLLLSDLAPNYISESNLMRLVGVKMTNAFDRPTFSAKVDAEGSFQYFGETGSAVNLILISKSNYFNGDLNPQSFVVITLTSNLTPVLRKAVDVSNRIEQMRR